MEMNVYRRALEEIVLELQRQDNKTEMEFQVAEASVEYNKKQLHTAKIMYDTTHKIYNYVNALYENAVANKQIQTLDGYDSQ